MHYIGLDIHKKIIEACALNASGSISFRLRFPCSRQDLLDFAKHHLHLDDHLCFEATTNSWGVASILKPFVSRLVVSNPLKTKAIAEAKIKTDKIDALVLAQLLRCDFLPSVWEPDDQTQLLRRLTRRRASLVAYQTALKNQIHSLLHMRLLHPPQDGPLFGKQNQVWLSSLNLDEDGRLALDSFLRLLAATQSEISLLDSSIAKHAYNDPRAKLLMSLPGVDFNTAQALLAAWGDLSRFKEADKAASYLGLVSSTFHSAFKTFHGHITKQGNSSARFMLVQAAHHLDKNPGPLGVFFRRLKSKKGYNVAVVASARKLATIAWHMLKNNEPYRYSLPLPTQYKLQKLRVLATGLRRKSGPPSGSLPGPALAKNTRSRLIPSLPSVFSSEGLPLPTPCPLLPKGEQAFLSQAGLSSFASNLHSSHRVPRRSASSYLPKGHPGDGALRQGVSEPFQPVDRLTERQTEASFSSSSYQNSIKHPFPGPVEPQPNPSPNRLRVPKKSKTLAKSTVS